MQHTPLVWITGARGLIGNYLVQLAPQFAPLWRVAGLTRAELDLLDPVAARRLFDEQMPAAIIHCAAISKSPECQVNPPLARRVNVEATALLAELAADIPFVFFSSDLVFDGKKGNYVETDPVGPLSIYAETKVAAEQIVLANPRHTVIRTSLNGGISPRGDSGFNEQLRRDWENGKVPKFFADEFRCPIPAVATARATWELLNRGATGLFHVAGAERLSRLQIGQALASRHPGLNPKFLAGSLKEYSGAPRPADSSLNSAKAQRLLSFPLPGLTQWLADNPDAPF
ncbi:MAG TPA: SDR family oxidoreductase [Verrucomicrobiae bacterium]|nr:SDR family oxidoreductase [Verrucomicrobiae bacterium]